MNSNYIITNYNRAQLMSFKHNRQNVVFDDFNEYVDENGTSYWSQMCSECRKKYAGILDDNLFDNGAAGGTCGVQGCWNEADDYVDFAPDKVDFLRNSEADFALC